MPKADRAMPHVGVAGLLDRVVIDVDHVVEHPHRRGDGALELVVVQHLAVGTVLQVLQQVDRAQVADSRLGIAGVERDLGAQVGRVHDPDVLLRRSHVAGILEGDPGMAGLEQHAEHLAPHVGCLDGAAGLDLAAPRLLLVGDVGLFELDAELVVQVRHVRRREQRPFALFDDAPHEQVGDPVGGVHVMGAPAVVAGVLAQFQELLDVQVPAFQVGADGALALAALVHGHGRVVDDLEERHHALRFAVGALDVRAQRPHPGPVVAQAAGKLGQQGVFLDRLVDAVQVVGHRGEIAGRQLGAQGAAVEQGRRAGHEVEARQDFVELDGAGFAVDLVQGQAHRHAHEEGLGQLDSGLAQVQEIAVVQGLQAQVVELQVALGLEGGAQPLQVVLQQLLVQQFVVHPLLDEAGKVVGIALRHFRGRQVAPQHFLEDGVQQQPGGGIGVVGVFLDQRARGQDRGLVDLVHRNAVVQVAHGLGQHRIRLDVGAQVLAGRDDQALEVIEVQRHPLPAIQHMQDRGLGLLAGALLGAFLGAALSVQHVGAGDLMMAAAHQAQFDLVLHVFDMEGAAGGPRTHQRPDHCLGELVHRLAHARRSRALRAVHGQERLHHGDCDLVRLERDHRAIAPDDLVMGQGRGRSGARRAVAGIAAGDHVCGGGCAQGNLHVVCLFRKFGGMTPAPRGRRRGIPVKGLFEAGHYI